MANPFPFTAGQVLTAAQLNGIGEYVDYTPTYTNFTLGNGTVTARYARVQDIVVFYVRVVLGSTSSVTGQIQVSLPVTSSSNLTRQSSMVNFLDAGTANFTGVATWLSTTTVALNAILASGTYASATTTSSTIPFTWTTSDEFEFTFVYEAA